MSLVTGDTLASLPSDRPDDLGQSARRRTILWGSGLSLGLLVTLVLGIGAVSIDPGTVLRIVTHNIFGRPVEVTWTPAAESIVWQVRLPRVLLGAAVGAGLAVCGTIAALTLWARQLDALSIGDETAHTLGVSPNRFRVTLLLVVSLCIGAVVAASGGIGFVGLVIPHVARRRVGAVHSRVVPVAALVGAIFLVWADVVARGGLQPRELPIGIITALVGAPFLLLLVRKLYANNT